MHPRSTKCGYHDKRSCLAILPTFRAVVGLAGYGPKLPANLVADVSTAPANASHDPLTLQGCLAIMFGRTAQFPGWGCVGCELYRETGIFRGSRLMSKA
eukprot:673765-Pelagomonas_calceolata.AAC.9